LIDYNGAIMIKVFLFASLKETAGCAIVEVGCETTTTPADVFEQLVERFHELERYRSAVSVAVNQEHSHWQSPLHPGDELAFFPPVSGGVK
jgi:molybdopterin converting factor subunit 1